MYRIKTIELKSKNGDIREPIQFENKTNLIVDMTPSKKGEATATGNNIGKTTFLELIDFVLGAKKKVLFTKNNIKVQDFLINNNFLIKAVFVDEQKDDLELTRSFKSSGKVLNEINGEKITSEAKYWDRLGEIFFSENINSKSHPSYRHLMSRVVRYDSKSVEETFQYLNDSTTGRIYESIFFYMFNWKPQISNDEMQDLESTQNSNKLFYNRLSANNDITQLEVEISLSNIELAELDKRRNKLLSIPDYQTIMDELVNEKKELGRINQQLSNQNIKKKIIEEQKKNLEISDGMISSKELSTLYGDAVNILGKKVQKSFEDVVGFVNGMKENRYKFTIRNMEEINLNIERFSERKDSLLLDVDKKEHILLKGDIGEITDIEKLISDYSKKADNIGRLNERLDQLKKAKSSLDKSNKELKEVTDDFYDDEHKETMNNSLLDFNQNYLTPVFKYLYGEEKNAYVYVEIGTNKNKNKFFKLNIRNSINADSAGSKQALTIAFDIAYLEYSRDNGINTPDFVISDRKELVDKRQLKRLTEYSFKKNIQLIFPILQDKLDDEIFDEANVLFRLSEKDKLFRLENNL